MDASDNQTTNYMNFEKDQWYNINLMVNIDTIRVLIDQKVVINYIKSKYDQLS